MAASIDALLAPEQFGGGDSPLRFFSETIPDDLHNYYTVFLNGTLIGVIPNGEAPNKFVDWVKDARRARHLFDLGISVDHAERKVVINTDAGRIIIPLIPAKFILDESLRREFDTTLRLVNTMLEDPETAYESWEKLLESGVIELYDQVMLTNTVVAESIEDLLRRPANFTHIQLPCEHCGMIMSLACSCPMNAGARNVYLSNQWKQSIGATIRNPTSMYFTELNLLQGAQRPLVRSVYDEITGLGDFPLCQNVPFILLSAVENQSDALIINQGAIDRGAFVVHHLEHLRFKPDSPNASFGVPDMSKIYSPVAPPEAYAGLDRVLGIPTTIGQSIRLGDVIAAITKSPDQADISRMRGMHDQGPIDIRIDVSQKSTSNDCPNDRHPTPSRLIASFSSTGDNDRERSIVVNTTRFPAPGDKFASQHAQKSIVGLNRSEWEMPYTDDGIRPTFLFNPPSLLKRETAGQLMFLTLGKLCALFGTSLDRTPFLHQVDHDAITRILEEIGYRRDAAETAYDPTTGIPYANPCAVGILAYMRQKRMVDDLVQCRYHGPREMFSHMAVKGKTRKGGVSFDEMTRNATLASGSSLTARDCQFEQAAPTKCYICDKCKQIAYPLPNGSGIIHCDRCGNLDPAISHEVRVPYNVVLLSAIFAGAGCSLTTGTDSDCVEVAPDPASQQVAASSTSVMAFDSTDMESREEYSRVGRTTR